MKKSFLFLLTLLVAISTQALPPEKFVWNKRSIIYVDGKEIISDNAYLSDSLPDSIKSIGRREAVKNYGTPDNFTVLKVYI